MTSLLFAAAAVGTAVVIWWLVPTLRAWPPSLGLMIAVLTVVPPHDAQLLGVGADDLLLLVGLALLAPAAWRAYRDGQVATVAYGRWLVVGAGLLISGMVLSAFVNGQDPADTVAMLARGAGRLSLYVLAVLVVVAQTPPERVRGIVARTVAGMATFEAVVGLIAYTVGLPGGFGLEEAQGNTTLVGEVPGRISGTLELSPNFLGALFVLSIPLTVGLALDAARRAGHPGKSWSRLPRPGWLWLIATVLQVAGLILTYTRASLAVMILASGVVLAARLRWRWLAAAGVAVGALLWFTPSAERLLSDHTDRLALYASAWQVFLAHPIAGVGPGQQAEFTAADPQRFRATSFGVAGNNAHNTVLLAAAENGIIAMAGAVVLNIGLALIAIAVIRRAWGARGGAEGRSEQLAVGVAVLAFLLQGMVNNLFTVTLTATTLVLVVAGCALPWLRAGPDPATAGDALPAGAAEYPGQHRDAN